VLDFASDGFLADEGLRGVPARLPGRVGDADGPAGRAAARVDFAAEHGRGQAPDRLVPVGAVVAGLAPASSSQACSISCTSSPAVETTFADMENSKGWRITWNAGEGHLELECPEGKFCNPWPTELRPGERRADVFKRMNSEHREQCGQ
jgi:hypothetical protein